MLVLLVLDLRRIDKAVEKAVQAATASMAKHLTRIQEELAKVKEELADERCRRINIEGDYENLYARWLAGRGARAKRGCADLFA